MKNATLSGGMPGRNVIGRFVENNRKIIVEVIAALFILLFVYTAISKLTDVERFKFSLYQSPLADYVPLVAWGIPLLEILIALLLFFPKTKRSGLYASFTLMVLFTLYISYMLAFTPKLPCSCGGVIQKMSWKQHLAFNILFSLLAVAGILLTKKRSEKDYEPQANNIVFT